MNFVHKSVLLHECIDGLNINPSGIYVDGTMGGAGHSLEILKHLSSNGLFIGIDRDSDAIEVAKERLKDYKNTLFIQDNHDNILNILEQHNIEKVDGVLLDLGVSSYQLDEASRGFSYMQDSPLDMRMDKTQTLNAKTVVNTYKEEDLANIIYDYGEERFSRNIAKKICEYRKNKSIESTKELVNIIESALPSFAKNQEGHPAKRTFQAIRIEVNNEIEPLYQTILNSIKALNNKGRLACITFHSLEDRAVKNAFIKAEGRCTCPKDLPYCVCNPVKLGRIITKSPILPSNDEMKENSRSKSAKLRIFEREI